MQTTPSVAVVSLRVSTECRCTTGDLPAWMMNKCCLLFTVFVFVFRQGLVLNLHGQNWGCNLVITSERGGERGGGSGCLLKNSCHAHLSPCYNRSKIHTARKQSSADKATPKAPVATSPKKNKHICVGIKHEGILIFLILHGTIMADFSTCVILGHGGDVLTVSQARHQPLCSPPHYQRLLF